jgi:hypothetical protein
MSDDDDQNPAPAPGTKAALEAELASARRENENLRGQLTAAGVGPRVQQPAHTFQLSEGDRQELVAFGRVNVGGVMRTRDEIADMLGPDQQDVDLGDAEPTAIGLPPQRRSAVEGVDFVYPSVEPGYIDPKVAGTPGINGPSADTKSKK